MTETEGSIYVERLAEREEVGGRISRINTACQVFTRGFKDGIFTFTELRRACRFLSTLIESFDRDARDLCLLASNAEKLEQFKSVCRMSHQRWRTRETTGEMVR